jgi:putative hydrolase of the HAD superfamily
MAIKGLMVDVDGVVVQGKQNDAQHWSTSLKRDLGISPDDLQREFFEPYWNDIVLGRAALMDHVPSVLNRIAPNLNPERFLAYWFEQDSRLNFPLLEELAAIRSEGIPVYLATNQEHTRASYLMDSLRLKEFVDGIYYSAQLGYKKPQPEFFNAVVLASGVASRDLLLVEDTLANLSAAAALGWNTLHWSSTSSPNDVRTALEGESDSTARQVY